MRTRRTAASAAILTVLTLVPAGALPSPAQAAGNTLTVNVGTPVRPVTHVAAGGLYAVDTGTTPPLEQMYPLRLNHLTQPPPGGQQLGNGATRPCCDGLQIAGKVTSAGAQQFLRMPDIYPNFPYRWVSWADWEAKVAPWCRPGSPPPAPPTSTAGSCGTSPTGPGTPPRPARSTPAGPAPTG